MATQQIYFINPNTVTNLDNNVTTLSQGQTDLHLPLRTDLNHIRAFMTGSLGVYSGVKMMGGILGQVSPTGEFKFTVGSRSMILTSTGSSNLVGADALYNGGTLINPTNAFGEVIADNTNQPFTEDSYVYSLSLGKTFYSAVLMALVDRGIIRLNDPIIQYFPEWKNMKVLTQKFFTNGTGCYAQTGSSVSLPGFISAGTGTQLDTLTVTLTSGQTDTIANFVTAGLVQLVDTSLLPTSTGANNVNYQAISANSVGPGSRYYIEVQPIQILKERKTYGTVAMAFSHQIGLGMNITYNNLITNVLRDRGLYQPALAGTAVGYSTGAGAGIVGEANINAFYPDGLTTQKWMTELLGAGVLSSQPGKVWEYDTGIMIGVACCEKAYQRYYNLPQVKPMWQIARELLLTPMGITTEIMLKEEEFSGLGISSGAVKNNFTDLYSNSGNTMISAGRTFNSLLYYDGVKKHDICYVNLCILSLKGLASFAYMLANYGVAKNGVRVLSKAAVKSMCETNYLDTNVDMYWRDDVNYESESDRFSVWTAISQNESMSHGLGGAIARPRPGKVIDIAGMDFPDEWFFWNGANGFIMYVKPSEGKYIVLFHKNNPFTSPSNITYGTTDSNTYFVRPIPASYETYGLQTALSAYNF
jgi:CubicO group peptidase (beta-lactamase class C family)